jgi:hypothetical protein
MRKRSVTFPRGIVLINQIKGRSGKVVFREEDGSFEKVGRVSLWTGDKKLVTLRYGLYGKVCT